MSDLYAIQSGPDGPIKIGKARDPQKRLAALQTASPYELRIVAIFPGEGHREAELHDELWRHRMCGEWFEPAREVRTALGLVGANRDDFNRACVRCGRRESLDLPPS